jgi:hypothetical protein
MVEPVHGQAAAVTASATAQAAGRAATQLKIRVSEELKVQLEAAAAARGHSLSAEVSSQLTEHARQEAMLGDAETRRLAIAIAVTFNTAARLRAGGPVDWRQDREAYRSGMFAMIDLLLAGLPGAGPEEIAREIEGLKMRLLSRAAREAEEQVSAGTRARRAG